MSTGIGGTDPALALEGLANLRSDTPNLSRSAYEERLDRLRANMQVRQIDAVYLNAGTNLLYFTGTAWHPSERMVGALVTHQTLVYVAPFFELGTLEEFREVDGEVRTWHEHESPYLLFAKTLEDLGIKSGKIALDESAPYFLIEGVQTAGTEYQWCSAATLTGSNRILKSPDEIRLLQHVKHMTLAVQKAAASILREGISTVEVERFIEAAHRRIGAAGSTFCIVLFGQASAFPHGVRHTQYLKEGDMVLIDTGCRLGGYHSDITRSYVFGEPDREQRRIWQAEKEAQAAAFDAAQPGSSCESVDAAARRVIEGYGLGPDYALPGLPHRTGHGVGLDIHEPPYIVRGNQAELKPGMCFSNEPMICMPGKFGVRLEDHVYITTDGPAWFTPPSHSIDEPFHGVE